MALIALLAGPALPLAASELITRVLPVTYRDAVELVEVLTPLAPPPGSISAFEGQLVVRTTAANMDDIRALLLELDRAPVNLLISVRHTVDEEVRRDLAAARVRLETGSAAATLGDAGAPRGGAAARLEGAQASVTAGAGRRISTRAGSEVSAVRVLEGREAFIRSGDSVPVGEQHVIIGGAGVVTRSGVRYEDFSSGFYVRPRLSGERVTLDIIRQRRELTPHHSARVEEVATSVSGILGRWMELTTTDHADIRSRSGVGSSRTLSTRGESGIYVKVERIAP